MNFNLLPINAPISNALNLKSLGVDHRTFIWFISIANQIGWRCPCLRATQFRCECKDKCRLSHRLRPVALKNYAENKNACSNQSEQSDRKALHAIGAWRACQNCEGCGFAGACRRSPWVVLIFCLYNCKKINKFTIFAND